MAIKEELIKATQTFDVVKILNEAERMSRDEVAQALGTTGANIDRTIRRAMGKLYDDIRKQLKANPAQISMMLMDYYNCEAEEVLGYLGPEKRAEVEAYVRKEYK